MAARTRLHVPDLTASDLSKLSKPAQTHWRNLAASSEDWLLPEECEMCREIDDLAFSSHESGGDAE